jgi:hypothetical protein
MLFRASSADGRKCGAMPEGLDRLDRHRMTLPQIRRPSVILAASLSLGSNRVDGVADRSSCAHRMIFVTWTDLGLCVVAGVGFEPT